MLVYKFNLKMKCPLFPSIQVSVRFFILLLTLLIVAAMSWDILSLMFCLRRSDCASVLITFFSEIKEKQSEINW